MIIELLPAKRGTFLRKNDSKELNISINRKKIEKLFLINGTSFITDNISISNLTVKPNDFYMIINNGKDEVQIKYSLDVSNHEIIYNPYKFENSEKVNLTPDEFKQNFNVPEGYIDTLPKWYSFKFTYPNYNWIFVKPEMGLSIQIHKYRSESWEILEGNPIIINGNKVHYYVENGSKFKHSKNTYHSIINPNKDRNKFVIIKESWSGVFDEDDIIRKFNPNKYK